MAQKGRPKRYSKKRVVTKATTQRFQDDTDNRFEGLSDWESYDPRDEPSLTDNQAGDDQPHQAFSKDREAPSWIASSSDANFKTKDDAEEKQQHEKFVKVLHSVWASATNRSTSDNTTRQAFETSHPQSLEERLNSLREGEPPHRGPARTSERTSQGNSIAQRNEVPRTTDTDSPARHVAGQRDHAFSEEGLPGIVDKLRPDMIDIHPDDRMIPAPKQKRSIHWGGQAVAVAVLLGISLGAFLLYQNGWLINASDETSWQIPPAFTTPKAETTPAVAATVQTPVVKETEQSNEPNLTPPPVTAEPKLKVKSKSQERIASPIAPIAPKVEAPLPEAPPLPSKAAVPLLSKAAPPLLSKEAVPLKVAEMAPPLKPAQVAPSETTPSNVTVVEAKPLTAAQLETASIAPQSPAAPVALPAPPVMVITPAAELPKQRNAPQTSDQTTTPSSQRVARIDPDSLTTSPKPSAATPPLSIAQTSQQPLSETKQMVAQADQHMLSGDISAARLLYEFAAQAGDVEAAVKLAQTYDPIAIESMKVQGIKPNPKLAQIWYQFASERGNAVATRRSQALKVWLARINQLEN